MDDTRNIGNPPAEDVDRELRSLLEGTRKPPQAGLSERRLHTILHFVESSLHRQLSVTEMAAAVHLSPFHFSRAFAKAVGQAPHTYLTHRRMERAKRLIAGSNSPLSLIALQVGYRAHSHFTGVFVRYVGMTPGRYRQLALSAKEAYGGDCVESP
jgi:AraC family transcriptional regulator